MADPHLRSVLEALPDAAIVYVAVREHGRIVDLRYEAVNAQAAQVISRRREDLEGHRLLELLPAHRDSGLFAHYVAVVETGTPFTADEQLYRDEHLDGWYRIHATRWGDGLLVIFCDVTAERNARERARQARDQAEQVLASIDDAVCQLDAGWRFTYLNAAARRVLDAEFGSVLGRDIREVFPATIGSNLERRTRQAIEQQTSAEFEAYYPEPLHTWYWVRVAPTPDGGFTLYATDITARKHSEEQRLRQQRLTSLGGLAGGVAHDFNNLLTVIYGHTALLRPQCGPEATPHLEAIAHAAEQGSELTRRLLAFGREQVLRPRRLRLASVVRRLEPLLARLLSGELTLRVVLGADDDWVRADTAQLEQVLLNLVTNARDAMPHGGTLDLAVDTVVLPPVDDGDGDLAPGRYARLRVADTGIGMDQATLERALDPFFSTKDPDAGSGFGLASAYGFVVQSGGTLTLDSEPGVGTTATVLLPLAPHAPAAGAEEPLPSAESALHPTAGGPSVAGAGGVVLLVDDHDAVRATAAELLEAVGYEVLAAANAAQALELADAHDGTIHLLLTDLVMPGMRGHELARELVARRPGLRVLVMSGYAERGVLEQAGADLPLLTKPFARADLLERVATTMTGPPLRV